MRVTITIAGARVGWAGFFHARPFAGAADLVDHEQARAAAHAIAELLAGLADAALVAAEINVEIADVRFRGNKQRFGARSLRDHPDFEVTPIEAAPAAPVDLTTCHNRNRSKSLPRPSELLDLALEGLPALLAAADGGPLDED